MLRVSCLLVRHTSWFIGSITNARDAVRTIHSTVLHRSTVLLLSALTLMSLFHNHFIWFIYIIVISFSFHCIQTISVSMGRIDAFIPIQPNSNSIELSYIRTLPWRSANAISLIAFLIRFKRFIIEIIMVSFDSIEVLECPSTDIYDLSSSLTIDVFRVPRRATDEANHYCFGLDA